MLDSIITVWASYSGLTYQVDSHVGLDLKLAKIPPEDTLKLRRSGTILREFWGILLGPVLITLGPALQGCPLDR